MEYNYEGYLIKDNITFAKFIAHKLGENKSAVRMHKGMYLVFKAYAATFGNIAGYFDYDVPAEYNDVHLPNKLFPANFAAWKFGPVEVDVFEQITKGDYHLEDHPDDAILINNPSEIEKSILDLIDDLIVQINAIHDFGLVDITRRHSDYKKALEYGVTSPIPEHWIVDDSLDN